MECRRLTLDERVGQLFVLGFQGTSLDRDTAGRLERIRPGGLVFLQRNIESLDQVYALNTALAARCEIPPLLAIDQEGGAVDRLKHAIAPMPSIGDLADSGVRFVRAGARILARELTAAGFNTSLSPILDLGLPGSILRERSLGAGAGEVTRLGGIQIEEFARERLLSAAAHFPGLGAARIDPHFRLPRIGRSRRALLTGDVVPFNELAGQLDMIRISHGHYPSLGDIRPQPASLSHRVVTDLLRNVVGFEGVAITDDLTMGAVTSRGLTPRTFLDAVHAGNDMLLFSQTTPLVEEAFTLILRTAASDGELRKRIDRSVERILHLKAKLEFSPPGNRAQRRQRLVRQIGRLRRSVPDVERIRVP